MPVNLIGSIAAFFQDTTDTSSGNSWLAIIITFALAAASYLVVRYPVLNIVLHWLESKNDKKINIMIGARIPHLLTRLVPALVAFILLPFFTSGVPTVTIDLIYRLLAVYVIVVVTLLLNAGLVVIKSYYNLLEYARTFPITSILDVVRAVLFTISAILLISILLNISLTYILAITAALLAAGTVVFNNLILAFISGLILTSKKLVMIGDWIEIPEFNINGSVQEITLTTVIVRNRDHTVGTVPSSYLISNTFKNWRGVDEDRARLLSWTMYFDLKSVKAANRELLDMIARLPHGAALRQSKADTKSPKNSRPVAEVGLSGDTNLNLFREYFDLYLQNNPLMIPEQLLTVYFDAPTTYGLPMKVMVSTHETDYARFLGVQSRVMEDVLQLADAFELKVFQFEELRDPLAIQERQIST